MAVAYIGLGSNLELPEQQVQKAIKAIQQFVHTKWLSGSSLYLTKPWGITDQPDFVNAVVCVETSLTLNELFDLLLVVEQQQGRVRNERYGPRIIDCDILWFDDRSYEDQRLTVPHPRLLEREFVLCPLAEIAPNLRIQGKTVAQWCHQMPATNIKKIVTNQDVIEC